MKGKRKKPKPTKAQVSLRVEEILRIRLDGAELWDIREYVGEQEQKEGSPWCLAARAKPLSESQLYRYIEKADRLISESCAARREKLIDRHLAQRRNLYAKAVSAGDLRTALAVLTDEAKLENLYPPTKIAPTNPDGTEPYDGDTEKLLDRLLCIMAKGQADRVPEQPAQAGA